nr:translation initiation factor IF-2-like [Aegilops tauschii subsp. strangulata]
MSKHPRNGRKGRRVLAVGLIFAITTAASCRLSDSGRGLDIDRPPEWPRGAARPRHRLRLLHAASPPLCSTPASGPFAYALAAPPRGRLPPPGPQHGFPSGYGPCTSSTRCFDQLRAHACCCAQATSPAPSSVAAAPPAPGVPATGRRLWAGRSPTTSLVRLALAAARTSCVGYAGRLPPGLAPRLAPSRPSAVWVRGRPCPRSSRRVASDCRLRRLDSACTPAPRPPGLVPLPALGPTPRRWPALRRFLPVPASPCAASSERPSASPARPPPRPTTAPTPDGPAGSPAAPADYGPDARRPRRLACRLGRLRPASASPARAGPARRSPAPPARPRASSAPRRLAAPPTPMPVACPTSCSKAGSPLLRIRPAAQPARARWPAALLLHYRAGCHARTRNREREEESD